MSTKVSLKDLALYFLKLGTFGFGGPVVLTARMQTDLVDKLQWITQDEYLEGLALAQLSPGPLAAQLAMYIGWLHSRAFGGAMIGVSFVLPSFLIVLGIAWLYVRLEGLPWISGLFYGIGSSVIAIMAVSVNKLVKRTFGKDKLLWCVGAVVAFITAWFESEILWVFIAGGLIVLLMRAPKGFSLSSKNSVIFPTVLAGGFLGTATTSVLWEIFGVFLKSGAFVFGSGLAIVPFLHHDVVQTHHWLNERQFIDAVAVAMITPGPVVITVAFIGYLVAGFSGSAVAAIGVFLPCYLFTVIPAPYFNKIAKNQSVKTFVDGITAAAIGAIAGATIVLARRALIDSTTISIALLSLVVLLKIKKIPEPVLILLAGGVGLVLR